MTRPPRALATASLLLTLLLIGCDAAQPGSTQADPASFGGGSLSVTITQLAPALDVAGNVFIWEADVSGEDVEACTFDWTVSESGGYGAFLFDHKSFTADFLLDQAGTFTVQASATCGSQTGTGTLTVYVAAPDDSPYPAPPSGTHITRVNRNLSATEAPPGPGQDAPNTVCRVYHGYNDMNGKYYRGTSSGCPGGPSMTYID